MKKKKKKKTRVTRERPVATGRESPTATTTDKLIDFAPR